MYTVLDYSMFYVNSLPHMCLISMLVETPVFPLSKLLFFLTPRRGGAFYPKFYIHMLS